MGVLKRIKYKLKIKKINQDNNKRGNNKDKIG